mmetsp:Transcript_109578/g.173077  ORF Transcript_109578/g.173077 Transcript_109578/m.173077 type:complete len:211 (+) Transcript_109578:550-1182(+)
MFTQRTVLSSSSSSSSVSPPVSCFMITSVSSCIPGEAPSGTRNCKSQPPANAAKMVCPGSVSSGSLIFTRRVSTTEFAERAAPRSTTSPAATVVACCRSSLSPSRMISCNCARRDRKAAIREAISSGLMFSTEDDADFSSAAPKKERICCTALLKRGISNCGKSNLTSAGFASCSKSMLGASVLERTSDSAVSVFLSASISSMVGLVGSF